MHTRNCHLCAFCSSIIIYCIPLFWDMVKYDSEFETNENIIQTKDTDVQLTHNMNIQFKVVNS